MTPKVLSFADIVDSRECEKDWQMDYYTYINSTDWQWFRDYVFREKGRRCANCGRTSGVLQVHHLHYSTFGFEGLEDVQVLCVLCHREADAKRRLSDNRNRVAMSWPRRVDRWATERWGEDWLTDHHPEEIEQQFMRWRKYGTVEEEEVVQG